MKRVLSIFIFVCLIVGMLPVGVFSAESSSPAISTAQISDRFKAIATGRGHTVALKEDGTVIAWGDNNYNKCIVPAGLTGVKSIAAGLDNTVALKEDGTVVAWGNSECGQYTVPAGLSGVKAIAAGNNHTVALKEDGTVVAWGNNQYGQCTIPAALSKVKAIAAGGNHTVALKEDGTVIAWGDNQYKQCSIPSGLSGVKSIAAGGTHTAALKEDGTVVTWGNNKYGQSTVPNGLSNVKAVAAGGNYTAALKEDGTVITWGDNSEGQCTAPSGLTGVTAVAAGLDFIAALKEDGTLSAWGNNSNGQCIIPVEHSPIKSICAGIDCAAALREDGTAFSWGNLSNEYTSTKAIAAGDGYIIVLKEDGTFEFSGSCLAKYFNPEDFININAVCAAPKYPVAVRNGTITCELLSPQGLNNIKALSSGSDHLVALKEDGTILAWGYNEYGQCNVPSSLLAVTGQAVSVKVKAIAAGNKHTLALKEDGTVVAWGDNQYGQCNVPNGLSKVKAIAASGDHSVALKEDGTIVAWGDNKYGECNIPAGFAKVKAIAAGPKYTLALKEDGTIIGIGWNIILFPKGTTPATGNSITPSWAEFDSSGIGDITVKISSGSKLLAVKNGSASLNSYDYSVSGNTVTIKKSYLSYYFTKFNLPGVKLNLTFDLESGVDPVLTVTPAEISNIIKCSNPVFDLSNPQDITFIFSSNHYYYLDKISNGNAPLNHNDYIDTGYSFVIKKEYLTYFFKKFNAPWQKLNLVFDFARGNDPMVTISQIPITNSITCENPAFDLSNPQDIKVNISGNTLASIKNGTASLNSNDYSISGNTVTIKKSYLSYFFTRFNNPWQQLNLTFDFEKGNDPLFTVKNSNISTSFIGLVKAVKIEGQSVTLVRDVNGVSTEATFSVNPNSIDLKTGSATATTSASAVNVPITWNNFVTNDMQNSSGDKTSVTDAQHRIYKFYISDTNKITKIERMNFESNITPTKFNADADIIETSNGRLYIDGTSFFDLKDNRVRYWKDIKGKSASKVILQSSMKANGIDANIVAFVNDTYKYVEGGDIFYAYVNSEGYAPPYYRIASETGDLLNLHQDDAIDSKTTAMDKQFISYTKNGDKIKINSVTNVIYDGAYTKGLKLEDVIDNDNSITLAWGRFVERDGRNIVVNIEGGDIAPGDNKNFIVDANCTTIKTAFKSGSLDKDNTTIQSYTDLVSSDQVGLVIADGLVRAIYFIR